MKNGQSRDTGNIGYKTRNEDIEKAQHRKLNMDHINIYHTCILTNIILISHITV